MDSCDVEEMDSPLFPLRPIMEGEHKVENITEMLAGGAGGGAESGGGEIDGSVVRRCEVNVLGRTVLITCRWTVSGPDRVHRHGSRAAAARAGVRDGRFSGDGGRPSLGASAAAPALLSSRPRSRGAKRKYTIEIAVLKMAGA